MSRNHANSEIRETLKKNSIPFWMVAEKIGVHESTVVRWFRTELQPVQRGAVLAAIDCILDERQARG